MAMHLQECLSKCCIFQTWYVHALLERLYNATHDSSSVNIIISEHHLPGPIIRRLTFDQASLLAFKISLTDMHNACHAMQKFKAERSKYRQLGTSNDVRYTAGNGMAANLIRLLQLHLGRVRCTLVQKSHCPCSCLQIECTLSSRLHLFSILQSLDPLLYLLRTHIDPSFKWDSCSADSRIGTNSHKKQSTSGRLPF